MQEQEAEKKEKKAGKTGKWNLIFFGLAGVLLLAALVAAIAPYRHLQLAEWREASRGIPCRCSNGTVLEQVEGAWHSSVGDARMELRAAYYPTATLTLDTAPGAGQFMLRFMDSKGNFRGDIHTLPYRDGKFLPARDITLSEDALRATVKHEGGFATKEEYLLHCLNEQEPLWRIHVWHHAEGAETSPHAGFNTIQVTP